MAMDVYSLRSPYVSGAGAREGSCGHAKNEESISFRQRLREFSSRHLKIKGA